MLMNFLSLKFFMQQLLLFNSSFSYKWKLISAFHYFFIKLFHGIIPYKFMDPFLLSLFNALKQ